MLILLLLDRPLELNARDILALGRVSLLRGHRTPLSGRYLAPRPHRRGDALLEVGLLACQLCLELSRLACHVGCLLLALGGLQLRLEDLLKCVALDVGHLFGHFNVQVRLLFGLERLELRLALRDLKLG